jgi:hypothetical protein
MPKQVPTSPTTIEKIMNTREFALGVIDRRAGRPHRSDYATWGIDDQWNYERGRAWATVAPRSVVLKRNGEITAEALRFAADII